MKRNFGHAGCAAMLRTFEHAGNRCVLSRWERLLSCSLLLQTRDFYAAHYEYLRAMDVPGARAVQCDVQDPRFKCSSYEIHRIRGDGTNTAVDTHDAEALLGHIEVCGGDGGDDK